jgi:transposase-like protein
MKPGRSKNSKKKKVVVAVGLTNDNKVKRTYSMCIEDYSSKSLQQIFQKHISTTAQITTDEWNGYKPLSKDYNITQIPSNNGQNFKQLHQIIHQIKSWIRTTYSWTHKLHTDKYLDEYSFRINRSIYKDTIFHKLIERMVLANPIEYKDIIIVTK